MHRLFYGFVLTLFLLVSAHAEEEPGWSMTVVSVADACSAPADQVELAASYISGWGERNLKDPSHLTKEKVLAFIKDNQSTKDIVNQKGAFIYPCSRWRQMLAMFNESKGAVMGGVPPPSEQKPASTTKESANTWTNREGKCEFFFDPDNGPIERINLSFDKDGQSALIISVTVNAKTLSSLGKKQGACRFYGDVTGFMEIGSERFKSKIGGSTACVSSGDGIGAQTQFVDFAEIVGDEHVGSLMRVMLDADSVPFTLTNAPRAGQKIPIPMKGLKQAIQPITICPNVIKQTAMAN